MVKPFRMLRYAGEAAGVCLAAVLIPLLPRGAVVGLSRLLGELGWRLAARDRRVALANLQIAFPGKTDSEREAIARRSFSVFAQVLCDYFWFGLRTAARARQWVTLDSVLAGLARPGPVVYLTAHFGNWEIMGHRVALESHLVSVAAVIENPLVDRVLKRLRTRSGQEIVPRSGALRALVRTLKEGGAVALVTDQNTLPEEGGIFVNLFSLPVPASKAGPALSRRMGAPLVFAYCVAEADGRYTAYAFEPVRIDQSMSDEEAAAVVARMMESAIEKHPEQWLWSYKRWKFISPGADADRFPFYARPYVPG